MCFLSGKKKYKNKAKVHHGALIKYKFCIKVGSGRDKTLSQNTSVT